MLQYLRSRLYVVSLSAAMLLIALAWMIYNPTPLQRTSRRLLGHQTYAETDQNSARNASLGFQKVLFINLPDRTDHRDAITLQCAVSGIHFEVVAGIRGDTVAEKVLPPSHASGHSTGAVGSWRAHMNALRQIVNEDLSLALILEDDVDWDVRLKDLLHDTARSTQAVLQSREPGKLEFGQLPSSVSASHSPYGANWDVIWLGHCGMAIDVTRAHLIHEDDASVPQPRYLRSWDETATSQLITYANHTRLIGHPAESVCSLAYAVSQNAARKLLLQLGLETFDMPFDLMLRRFCEAANCIGVLPQLFDHYRRKGTKKGDSEIGEAIDETERETAYTNNIRWSVRLNMDKMLAGSTDWSDQYPDA